jgi:DNA-binding NtrC family response regulator
MASSKVLLVDDEPEFVSVLSERLIDRGIDVEIALNGKDALEKISKFVFDAIFLDLAMPGLDGIETLKCMLEKNPDLLVYLLTGQATLQKGIEAVKLGAKDVLEKPAELSTLVEIIKKAEDEKILLFEKKLKENISDIVATKGW